MATGNSADGLNTDLQLAGNVYIYRDIEKETPELRQEK
jgi:hypothetical protein